MKYLMLIEKGRRNYSAYVPDLGGCVSTGATLAEVRKNIREAIEFHLDGMAEDGVVAPRATTVGWEVDVKRPVAKRNAIGSSPASGARA